MITNVGESGRPTTLVGTALPLRRGSPAHRRRTLGGIRRLPGRSASDSLEVPETRRFLRRGPLRVLRSTGRRVLNDAEHAEREDRLLLLGVSAKLRILMVCHCIREGDVIRLISARKATRNEQRHYPWGAK